MPVFAYRARDTEGRRTGGKIEADDEARAVDRLRERGLYITHLTRQRSLRDLLGATGQPRSRGFRVPVKDLALFCRQFGTMVAAGVPVLLTLQLLSRQTASPALRRVLLAIGTDLEAGDTLAGAFAAQAAHLPPALVNMAAAGEMGGMLDEVFNRLADHFEKEDAVSQKVRSALAYPVVVLVMAVAVIILMLAFVVPNFVVLFETLDTELPWPTLMLLQMSDLVRENLLWFIGGLIVASLGLKRFLSTERGAEMADRVLLRLPAIGELVSKQALARLCRTLSTLMGAGVPILVSLQVVRGTVGNRVVAAVVEQARQAVLEGEGMTGTFRSASIIPAMVAEMISVGEETGQMESMLMKVAEFYERDIDALVERFSAVIQPLIMAGLGLGIGFVLVAMIMPMFEVFTMIAP